MTNHSLPDAELDVLSCLWTHGDLTARRIREELNSSRRMTHSAVSTLLARLLEKKMVTRKKAPVGKAYVYRAVRKAQRAGRRVVTEKVDRVFRGDSLAVVSSLFETRPPSADELDQLQDLLDQLRLKHFADSDERARR